MNVHVIKSLEIDEPDWCIASAAGITVSLVLSDCLAVMRHSASAAPRCSATLA
ncbi:hypothetical protein [Streptomyces mirabilis]|uniref:hypothetical protein n=1 Tax=Streptomyces mirabilis TaxID=68239 RepID=UPI0033211FB9